MALLGDPSILGTKIWDTVVQRLFPLTGGEKIPIAQDLAGTGGKEYIDPDGLADYINGGGQSFGAIIPVTITSTVPNVYAGDPTPAQAAVSITSLYSFTIPATDDNTGSSTLDITFTTPLGAKTINKLVSGVKTNLVNGDLVALSTYVVYYDGTDYVLFNGKINTFYDNNGNLVIIGIDSVLNFPTTQSDMTFYVDSNGVDQNTIKKNPLSSYASIQQANTYAANSAINVNAGLYTQTSGSPLFINTVKYYLNAGASFTQNGAVSMITPSNNDTIYIRGYGKLTTTSNYPIINITTSCIIDIELDEVYQSYGCTTPLIVINANNVTGRIKIKRAWRDLSDTTNTSYLIDIQGQNILDVTINSIEVEQTQKAITFTNTDDTFNSSTLLCNYIQGLSNFVANGVNILNVLVTKLYASSASPIVQLSSNTFSALLYNGKIRNFNTGAALQLNASTQTILLQDVVAATTGGVSVINNATVTVAYGFVLGNGTISNPLTTGAFVQNANYQYV